jgi:hypothetical protein
LHFLLQESPPSELNLNYFRIAKVKRDEHWLFRGRLIVYLPLQNPTLGVVAEEVKSYNGKRGFDLQKPRCEALCRRLRGTEVMIAMSQIEPFGALRSTTWYEYLPLPWDCAGGDCLIPRLL